MRANVGGLLQYVTKSLRLRAGAVRSPAYAAAVVAFEFRESVYELTDNQATFWTLWLMRGLGRSTAPADAAALRDAMSVLFIERAPSNPA